MAEESSNRRVAKNTIILYCRMVITMLIGMWTSRLVINALGFTDQGLYNVVCGFIGLSGLITASMSGSISRFITFEIGRGNVEKINRAIQNAFTAQAIMAAIVIVVAETIGLWFLNNKLVIPADRLFAANVVYQLTILSLTISMVSGAPTSLVIAYEKMNVFAYVAVANSVMALLIGLALTYWGGDRLILYAVLQFIAALCTIIFYITYSRKTFPDIKYRFAFDKDIFYPIFHFAGWNGIGSSAAILRTSGTSILLNLFGGPIANTINGIANSISNLATIFVNDFTTAYSPQITKRYAAREFDSLVSFIYQCTKISFALLAVVAIPIFFNIDVLLTLWLKEIPAGTTIFGQLIIIYLLIECVSKPIIVAKNATGQIRNYQIVVGGILLLTIPLTYMFLMLGLPLYYSYISIIITSSIAFVARMMMLKGDIPMWSSKAFVLNTVIPCSLGAILCAVCPFLLYIYLPQTIFSVIVQCFIGFVWCCCCMFFVVLNKEEKHTVRLMLTALLDKMFRKRG